jgi:hypothetical protein
MTRVLVVLSALALLLGCRTPESNPFAAFGEATIPPPTIEVPGSGPYYTTPPGAAAGSTAPVPANSLPSISVPSGVSTPTPQPSIPRAPYSFGSLAPRSESAPSFSADPADREPIRIVEAAPGEARIATAPRAAAPSVVEAAPAAREPIRAFNAGPKTYTPEPYKPAFGQPPASGFKSSGSFPIGSGVQPAAYQYAVPAFVESPSIGGGQWRAR